LTVNVNQDHANRSTTEGAKPKPKPEQEEVKQTEKVAEDKPEFD
jgi:hypothetical protein